MEVLVACSRAVQPEGQSQAQSHASHRAAESVGSVHSPPAPLCSSHGFSSKERLELQRVVFMGQLTFLSNETGDLESPYQE